MPISTRNCAALSVSAALFLFLPAPAGAVEFSELNIKGEADNADAALRFETLEQHIGSAEAVNLNVYMIGFHPFVGDSLRWEIEEQLLGVQVFDTKPWWLPRIPLYTEKTGQLDFATVPAPVDLPPELTPPDGLIRYEPNSLVRDITTLPGFTLWHPANGIELEDLVSDWLRNNDVVYNMEHKGSLRDVEYRIERLKIQSLPAQVLDSLYTILENNTQTLDLHNPDVTYTLYSYNDLLGWLDQQPQIREPKGGAVLVLLNLERFADQDYAFYAEPDKDVVPVRGQGVDTRQYPPAVASTPELQELADILTTALDGKGLNHSKMLSSLELRCAILSTAEDEGLTTTIPGIRPDQSVCAEWTSEPIRNLLGNKGRRIFVSDSTRLVAEQQSVSSLVERITQDVFDLYRYGVLAQSIKGLHEYSEAQELRTLVVDLRFDNTDLCVLQKLGSGGDPVDCADEAVFFPTEKTYDVSDVFDSDLALKSLEQFAPGAWTSTLVPFDFSDLGDPVTIAVTKRAVRDTLSHPAIDLGPGLPPFDVQHFPFYRKLTLEDESGQLVELNSTFEKGLDALVASALILNAPPLGLGVYDLVWPDAVQVDERPYRETGKPFVHASFLYLTPPPDGPLGEKWGTFPLDLEALQLLGINLELSGGGLWVSVMGNEMLVSVARRDFTMITPQYILGPNRGAGNPAPWSVLPDGEVLQVAGVEVFFEKRIDGGAPHWCDEFNSPDPATRQICRDFVRTTTTLQAIETIQHGLGYAHTHEPRLRYHFDGEIGTQRRNNELFIDAVLELLGAPGAGDKVGRTLHQMVNMYTTVGVSSLWGQCSSDWNGVGPHAGMQATLLRSHVREEAHAAETELEHAIERYKQSYADDHQVRQLLHAAIGKHHTMKGLYGDWKYKEALFAAMEVLSLVDEALASMGEPDRIHDPILELGLAPFE